MTKLMQGFPPATEDQATLANWRTEPFNKWAFHHVREIIASADIPNDPDNVWHLEEAPVDLSHLVIDHEGTPMALNDFQTTTNMDAMVVLHHGKVVYETYANGMTATSPHILMSVSKSVLGLMAGILEGLRTLDTAKLVTHYVPEMETTAYKGATVQQLLDMRAGDLFDEDYLATEGPIVEYRKAQNWNPLAPGDIPSDLRSFYQNLTTADGPHGGKFYYVSPNTDLLGWVMERAAGRRYADLVSELLWQPMGAATSAYITVDRLGAPRCAGGMCTSARDLARIGQLMAQNGARDGKQIIPKSWVADITNNGDADAWAAGSMADYFPGKPVTYRSKWYIQDGDAPLLFGVGIHGQNVFADPKNNIVISRFSSQPEPLEPEGKSLVMALVDAIRAELAG